MIGAQQVISTELPITAENRRFQPHVSLAQTIEFHRRTRGWNVQLVGSGEGGGCSEDFENMLGTVTEGVDYVVHWAAILWHLLHGPHAERSGWDWF